MPSSTRLINDQSDTIAHTPSSSKKPHCAAIAARIARIPEPTRFNHRYVRERCDKAPNCANAKPANTSNAPTI